MSDPKETAKYKAKGKKGKTNWKAAYFKVLDDLVSMVAQRDLLARKLYDTRATTTSTEDQSHPTPDQSRAILQEHMRVHKAFLEQAKLLPPPCKPHNFRQSRAGKALTFALFLALTLLGWRQFYWAGYRVGLSAPCECECPEQPFEDRNDQRLQPS